MCTPHELRRDFADLVAEAALLAPANVVADLWRLLPEGCLDVLWARERPSDAEAFVTALYESGGAATGALLIPRSTLVEVAREIPSEDACGRNLRRLAAGEALAVLGNLLLGFDDARRPCIGFVATHGELLALLDRLGRLADQTVPALLSGETGTGKEVVARALHQLGRRRGRPWLAINCAEFPESILESELFGHARGSFTGATVDRAGLFEAAADGTVFLDEVGELPPAAQAKLLRVLEDHRVRRVGSSEARPLRCRIVAATNRDLPAEIGRGRFRSDLFYRLRGAEIVLRPLRERPGDILPLAELFAARAALRFRRPPVGLSEETRLALLAHRWPGNVRELRQAIEAAVLAADGGWIRLRDLSIVRHETAIDDAPIVTVHDVERAHILRALATTSGNKVAAARLLGLTRQSLQRRITRHGILLPAGNDHRRPDPAPGSGRSRLPGSSHSKDTS